MKFETVLFAAAFAILAIISIPEDNADPASSEEETPAVINQELGPLAFTADDAARQFTYTQAAPQDNLETP